jgi:hypothetical protein
MGSPKEIAIELIDKFEHLKSDKISDDSYIEYPTAKLCALIAVTEIINSNPHSNPFNTDVHSTMKYWVEVKKEIEKL